MQARKSIWPSVFGAFGLETATFISSMAEANPALTTGLLALTLAVDLYVYPKAASFFYKTYKESKNFIDFNVKLDMPLVSDLYKRKDVTEGLRMIQDKCCRRSR